MLRFSWTLLQISLILSLIAFIGRFNAPVQIFWSVYQIELSLLTLSFVLVVVLGTVLAMLLLWRGIRRMPRNLRAFRQQKRREAGYRALTRGMVAVAAGEKFAARKAARQAESLLQEPPLTMLLSAQSAQLDGDELAAQRYFTKMLEHEGLAFLGWRGLIMQALREGNHGKSRELIAQAEARFPKQPWLIEQALDFEQGQGNTRKALMLVDRARRLGALKPREAQQRVIDLQLASARNLLEKGLLQEARTTTEKVWKILKKQHNRSDFSDIDSAYDTQILLADVALAQGEDQIVEAALRRCWGWRRDDAILERIVRWSAESTKESLGQWKLLVRFFRDLPLSGAAALCLSEAALAVGLIGEAEAALERDPDVEHFLHEKQRAAIAAARQAMDTQ